MNKQLVNTVHYKGKHNQPLTNVFIHAPTIIWVKQGSKQLWWHEKSYEFNHSNWLLVPAGQYLTFVNIPEQQQFYSRVLTLHQRPPIDWLSSEVGTRLSSPQMNTTPSLEYCFEIIFDMAEKGLSPETQQQFLYGFYSELNQVGALTKLFPTDQQQLRDKLANYLSSAPGDDHKIDVAASHLAMSRATLTRKLAAEGSSFRSVLTEIRMTHALSLLQNQFSQIDAALACGYQSEARFSQRFKQQFGLTPHQYRMTL
ncbi:helix-turn-helix transcriptional regulator [Vibrio kasasachensis]|uniref:helix-turn-helix transcriptional regulator n=1 Tax=Vibrio kasasachensis TaxID=2910248 RepID=UPI003D09A42E